MTIMACMGLTSLLHGTRYLGGWTLGPKLRDKQDVAFEKLLSLFSHMYIAHNRRE